jgi:hypothetical protein
LPPEVLAKIEKRFNAEGKPVPQWIIDGQKKNSC